MSNKRISFSKGGKDWAVGSFSIQNQHIIHKTVTKSMYHLPFQRRHELNAVKLTSIQSFQSFPPFGVGGPFVFQLHTLG